MSKVDDTKEGWKMTCSYRGRALDSYSKKELIEIVQRMGEEIKSASDRHLQTLSVWDLCRKGRNV